jgi:anti-sigma B factor antagonist
VPFHPTRSEYNDGSPVHFIRTQVRYPVVSNLRTSENGDVLVVYFNDNKILDESKIQQIHNELNEKLNEIPAGKLLVNFDKVTFMSSAMIGKIILLNKKCKASDIKFKLCSISDNVMEVFKLMRLNKVLDIQKDEATAIASFDKKGWFG